MRFECYELSMSLLSPDHQEGLHKIVSREQKRGQARLPDPELIRVAGDHAERAFDVNQSSKSRSLRVGKAGLPPLLAVVNHSDSYFMAIRAISGTYIAWPSTGRA